MTGPLRCPGALSRTKYHALRARMIFEHGKLDPQFGDVEVLAPYPLVLDHHAWAAIAADAEALAAEAAAAEAEVLSRPDLLADLGLPRAIRRALAQARPSPDTPRCTRFDFHPTADGWRISEANSDVPGGFIEAAGLADAMAEHYSAGHPAGDPGAALADAVLRRAGPRARVGLVHATAYSDDRQVMLRLARRFTELGAQPTLLAPDRIAWRSARAHTDDEHHPLDALVRFYPGEWLANLSRRTGWPSFFTAETLQVNPPSALITQSKRFPLVWDRLTTPMPTWRALLPETRDPRDARRQLSSGEWVLKPALGRVGDGIGLRAVSTDREWRRAARAARRWPNFWAAQRRFHSTPTDTPHGERHACLGVFVIDGRAAGIYARLAPQPLINASSQDVAVLIAPPTPAPTPATVEGPRHARTPAPV